MKISSATTLSCVVILLPQLIILQKTTSIVSAFNKPAVVSLLVDGLIKCY